MSTDLDAIADRLLQAEASRQPIAPLTTELPDLSTEDAYKIQLSIINRKLAAGARVVGRKIGLTSKAMQRQLNVDQPDYGHLLDTMAVSDGGRVAADRLIQPRIEPEIAFVMARDLKGPGVTQTQVLNATRWVMPALEIIDSRIEGWKIKLNDTIADNASSAMFVLGGRPTPVDNIDLRLVGMVLEVNGEIVSTGAGAAILGHPLEAVVWLVNKLAELGSGVREGDVLMPGALTAAAPISAGDRVVATFDHIGAVTAQFT